MAEGPDGKQHEYTFFSLRSIRYRYGNMTVGKVGGEQDGIEWHMALNRENECVWVSEDEPGEFVQAYILKEHKNHPIVKFFS